MKNLIPSFTVVKTLSVLFCLVFTQQLSAQCPTIQFVDLRGTPGFPQTDDLNVCGEPDTLSILMFTDAPGQVKGFEFTVNMVSGMRYAGFEEAHYGGCTSLTNSDPDISSPSFIGGGLTCGDIFVANIGVTADCSVDLVSNDYLIEIEYSYTYFPPTGGSIKCSGVETLDNDFNGAMKVPVLNMFTPSPIDVTVTSLGDPACQTFTISQDGLQAYLDEFNFAVCGLEIGAGSPVSVSSMTANGIDLLANTTYNPADTSLTVNIDNSFFASNGSPNSNGTDDQFDTAERMTFEICYEVANCPSGADIPFSYKAWYGCFDEVCQQTGQASFLKVRPTGSLLPTITASLDNGIEICGEDAKVSATVTNPNTDTDQNVYTDISIGFQACGMEAFQITDVMINGISVSPVFEIVGDDIDIDLSMNTDPGIGLVDYDGDGFYDDLPGGADPLDIMVFFSLACGAGDEGGCPEINCPNVQFYLKGKTNCGNNFQGFPTTGGFNLQYGQEDVSNPGEDVITGTTMGYDFGTYSNDGAPIPGTNSSEITIEFCYEFAQQNIEDCPSGGETKMVAHFGGPAIIMADLEVVSGTVMMDDGSGYAAVPDADVTLTPTSDATSTLEINAGNNNATLCYKYNLKLDDCHCSLPRYVSVDQQIVSVCSDCAPDCEIVKGCRNTLLRADPNCTPCPCMAQYVPVRTERKNLGYVDKEMTRKITRDELLAANAVDLGRFMPGDTLWHQGYWELLDEDLAGMSDPARWLFAFRMQTLGGSGTSGEVQAALPLTMEAGSMVLNEFRIENPDGSMHIVDMSTLPACMVDPTQVGATLNSHDTHFQTPWPPDPNASPACTTTSWEGYDGNQTYFEMWNFDRMEEINAINPSIGNRHTWGTGDCLTEFIETYGIVKGTKFHFDWCAPLIKNPLREMAKILGVAPAEQTSARILQQFSANEFDEIAGSSLYAMGTAESGCTEDALLELSCPGGIKTETNITIDNCGGTVEHVFVVDAFAGPPGDEWFTHEYKPLVELHDIDMPVFSPLAYCDNAQVDQNGIITPVAVDSTMNMSCSPVAGYADDLCAVETGTSGTIVMDLYDQGFRGLGIGLDNCDTLRIKYDYCMICPAPIEGLLDYELKVDWCYPGGLPTECQMNAATYYNPGNSGGVSTLGDEANAAGYVNNWHNQNYYNIFNLDTLFCKIDDTQGVVFVDDQSTPSMPVTASNADDKDLIVAGSPGTSIEIKEIEFCNPDPMDATGFSGYVTTPNAVMFLGACLDVAGTMPLVTSLISDDGQIKKYMVEFPTDVLASGDCISVFVKTTLLFCPLPGSLPPEICTGASSGCSPAEVRTALGGSGACSSSEVCYAYLFGEADLQTEWFSFPDCVELCEEVELFVRVKNVKDLPLLDLVPTFTLPFGMSVVPGSWEVAYPGGTVDMMGNFGPWTGVPDPDVVSGFDYSWSDDALWNSDIDMNGLPGVSADLDSNNVSFRLLVTTNCDEFLSGSKPKTETQSADPCGPEPLSSGIVESPALIVKGADPADFAQILAVGSPSELYCGGLDNQFGLTALNVSEKPTTDSVVTCITIPGDVMTYTPGSIMFTNGFMPAWITETPIGNDMQVCVHSPVLPPGQSWSLTFEAVMKEDAPCGEIEIPADIKSVVEAVSCVPGPPDECDVFVQNSLNPVILIDLKPPLETTAVRASMDCTAGDDPVQVCYEIDLSNPGPQFDGNMRVGIHDDVTANGTLESFDTELNGMDHAISLAPGEMTTVTMCLDIAAIQACPIIIKQTYETDCACDSEETPIMDLSPAFIADLEECVVLCPTQPLELETCGGYDISLEPAAGGVITDNGAGILSIVLNDGFGIPGTDPVKLVVTGTTGECEIMDMVELKSIGDWVPENQVADICENDCVDLDLQIPAELEDGATITWTPALGLDDPTIATPEVCDLTADQVYNVEIRFGDACVFNIEYTVTYNPNGITTITGEEFCLCQEAGTLTGAAGFASYEWYSIQSGAEILEFIGTTNTWTGPTEPGDYFLKAYIGGAICPNISNIVTLEGKECVDLELEKTITNIPTPVILGSQITYEIEVCNIADEDLGLKFDATNVEISDELPGAVTYVQHTQTSGNYSPTTNQWDISTLASGTCETLSIDVTIDEVGVIENTAQISGSDQEDIDSEENNDDGDQSEDDEDAAVIEVVCEMLGGEIFYDEDNNGCQDDGEGLVMEAINVSLYECGHVPGTDPPAAVTQTTDGMYEFGVDSDDVGADICLQPGVEYFVVFDIPNDENEALEDYEFSNNRPSADCIADGESSDVKPDTGATKCFDPEGDDDDDHIDAGITPPCYELAGEIFLDSNNDGCQDMDEGLVMQDVEVSLYECGDIPGVDQPQASTTVSDGMYEFGEDSDDPGADICLENNTEYFVVFDIPNATGEALEDYTFSTNEALGACAVAGESDNVDPTTGASGCYDPDNDDGSDGDDDQNIDAGIVPPCENIAGEIFYDNNDNGCQDSDEELVMETIGVSVFECGDDPASATPVASTVTNDGMYEFGPDSDDPGADVCLEAGTEYFVVFDIPSAAGESLEGYEFSSMTADPACEALGASDDTDPATGATDCVDPNNDDGSDGDSDNNLDAGISPPCHSLSGEIFYDGNNNGCQDAMETLVMEDINVSLYECGDVPGLNPPAASTTVSDGMYEFSETSDDAGADVCLDAGTEYFVVFDIPNAAGEALEDFTFSTETATGACATDGNGDDVDPATGMSACYDPDNSDGGDGDADESIDAGITPPCEQISGEIFYDLNDNGCEDADEELVMEDINVTLYECGATPGTDAPVAMTTVSDGMYAFGESSDDAGADVCLDAGTEYFVVFDIPNTAGQALEDYTFSSGTATPGCEASGESDDVDPSTGASDCVDPDNDDASDGNSDENVDAGIVPPCESLSGEIFYDEDNNGCQDPSDGLVDDADVEVSLYECGDVPGVDQPAASTTVSDGMYEFGEDSDDAGADICLQAGTEYFVVFDIPSAAGEDLEDYTFSTETASGACATSGESDNVDPSTGASGCYDPDDDDSGDGNDDNNIDAGITPPCYEISGEIFYDLNDNGCEDTGEELVMEPIGVTLYECGDTPGVDMPTASTTVTDGEYEFGEDSDDPGADVCLDGDTEYFVVFDIPSAAGEELEEYEFSSGTASAACEATGESDDVDPATGASDCTDPNGDDSDNLDAGIVPPCENIAGEIFYDANDNGCQDAMETLVMEDINVTLYECGDTPGLDAPVSSTTVSDGMYEFGEDSDDAGADVCLDANTEYFVVFDIPSGPGEALEDYEFSSETASGACATDGNGDDVDPNTGMSGCVDPSDDDADDNVDAGIVPPCEQISGEIFYDYNEDGCQDANENLVMEDIDVTLYECGDVPGVDPPAASTTVSDGMYAFGESSDDPGADICLDADTQYFVSFDFPSDNGDPLEDFEFTSGTADAACMADGESSDVDPATGDSDCVDSDGDDSDDVDAGIVPPCEAISGEIFYDNNDNGCQDMDESLVMEDINVSLYECGETPGLDPPVASTTVSDGMYMFSDGSDDPGADVCLESGTEYFVVFDIPSAAGSPLQDHTFSSGSADPACQAAGGSDDVDPATGMSACYDPDNDDGDDGDSDNNVDAGIVPPCYELAGEIYYDDNNNGCQDSGESLVMEAITVILYECGSTPGVDAPAAMTSIVDGEYEFGEDSDDPGADVCLEPNTEYFVLFDIPNGGGESLDGYMFSMGMATAACEAAGASDDVDPMTGASDCYNPDDSDGDDGNSDQNIDAGIVPPCHNLAGEIYYDNDDNGCQDPGEDLVMEDINVTLYECGDIPGTDPPVASTTVNDGMYEFGEDSDDAGADVCLEMGTEYFVVFDIPSADGEPLEDYEFSSGMADPSCLAAGASDDVNMSTGMSGCYDPNDGDGSDGDSDNNIDAGIVPPCEDLSGEIFYDDNANGCQDSGESLVMEIINVMLYECGDTPGVDAPVASTTVNDGSYEFGEDSTDPGADVCLESGTQYFVAFDIPMGAGEALDGFEFTSGEASPACESLGQSDDVDPTTGTSACYDPDNDDGGDGNGDENIDAGITAPCESLGGEIFYDTNGNGCEDATESLVMEDIGVSLYECGDTPGVDQPIASTTVSDGEYEFGINSDDPGADVCLDANTEYFVSFDIPNGVGEALEDYSFTEGVADASCAATGASDNVDPTTGTSGCHNPSDDDSGDGDDDENIDAGIMAPCESLSGEIFYDDNANGCQDGGESLVMEAINVSVYECGSTPGTDAPVASTSINDGEYMFGMGSDDPGADVCLDAGTDYFVVFDIPMGSGEVLDGYEFTDGTASPACENAGGSDDVDPTTGYSDCYDPNNEDGGDGDSDENIDAGITAPCESLGGEIFYDMTEDGCQDGTESLVMQDIGVTLYECGDTPGLDQPVASTIVSDGEYEFGIDSDDPGADVCLDADTEYFVVFDIPMGAGEVLDGFDFTTGEASGACAASGDSDDVDPTTGMSGCHNPSDDDGDSDNNIDAGITAPCASLSGEIFYDNNGDGCQGKGEDLVMKAVNIMLYECGDTPGVDAPVASAFTDDGSYEFGENSDDPGGEVCLTPGVEYFVVFDIPDGPGEPLDGYCFGDADGDATCEALGDNNDVDATGTSECGEAQENVDAGIVPKCESLAGDIFYDLNVNGCQDSGETLVTEMVEVSLYDCGDIPGVDQPIASTIVMDGEYEFGPASDDVGAVVCLEAATEYFVVFNIPNDTGEALEGYEFTQGIASGVCAVSGDSDNIDPTTGASGCYDPDDTDASDDDDDNDIDAGIVPPCESISGEIFYDGNENGCQDGNEALVTEVINVTLYECGATPGTDAPVASTSVNDGEYMFGMGSDDPGANVCLNATTDYFVVFDVPMGPGQVLDGYAFTEGIASPGCEIAGQSDDVDPTTGQSDCQDADGNGSDNVDVGIKPPCEQIAGEIFYDDNNNGCQDSNEPLVDDQTIEVVLYQCGDIPGLDQPAAYTSVTDGQYVFGMGSDDPGADICLVAGDEYFVEFHIPNGPGEALEDYYFSERTAAPGCLFSGEGDNIDNTNGRSSCHDPSNDDNSDQDADENIDAGIMHPCEIIGGEIFLDYDNDGCHDDDESLITDAVNVSIFNCGDDPATATPVSTLTTTDGTYQFGDAYSVDYTDDPCLNPRLEYFVVFDFDDAVGDPLEDHYFSDGEGATCAGTANTDDVHPDTGISACYDPDYDDEDRDVDAGITPCEEISGMVYYDWNTNGCQDDASETPVQGVDVYIFECGEANPSASNALASAITDVDGEYMFGPEEDGTSEICLHPDKEYFVLFDIPNGDGELHEDFFVTDGDSESCAGGDTSDDTDPTTATSGCLDPDDDDDDDDVNAGITPCEEIAGEVFYDNNRDGCRDDATEGPVPGVNVYVFECGTTDTSPANALATDTTDADGEYSFGPEDEGDANVCLDPEKSYFVVYDIPNATGESLDHFALTDGDGAACAGGDNSNVADPTTGASGCYDPDDDDDDENINAGIMPCEELAGEVFYDDDADGCKEEGVEEGVPGVDVYIFECGTADTSPANALASTTTNDDGEYKFGSGEEGNADICLDADKEYFVLFDIPNDTGEALEGFEFTDGDSSTCAGDDNSDNVDETTGTSGCYDPSGDDNPNAGIMSPVDVALTKSIVTAGPYKYEQEITFDIEVFNEGELDLYNIKVNDFIPCGFKYLSSNNGTWSFNPITEVATATIAGPLTANTSQILKITLELAPCTDADAYTNVAEIESMQNANGDDVTDDDVDSDGDNDPTNDDEEEDDADSVGLEIFDLALIKELATEPMYEEGDTVEFVITVVNQGNVTAANIQVADYLPIGYSYDASLNAGWDDAAAPSYYYNLPSTLAPNDTSTVSFFAIVEFVEQLQENYTNSAEISGATNADGSAVVDADSNPDGNPDNDGTPADNQFNDKGDEDDHDIESIDLTSEFIPSCSSDCEIQCIGQINVSLSDSCTAVITPAMGGVGIDAACNDFYLTPDGSGLVLYDEYGTVIPDRTVGIEHIGQNITYQLTEPTCGNKCWGNILVEYKLPPQIMCPPNDTLTCAGADALGLPPATGGCLGLTFDVRLIDEVTIRLDCDPDYTQRITRTYRAEDELGNYVECSHEILVERVDLTQVIFPDNVVVSCADTAYQFLPSGAPLPFISNGFPTGSGSAGVPIVCDPGLTTGLVCPTATGSGSFAAPLIPIGGATMLDSLGNVVVVQGDANQLCNSAITYTDVEIPSSGCRRKYLRTFEVTEWWCSGDSVRGDIMQIEVIDDVAPEIVCPQDFTISTDDDCAGSVAIPPIVATDNCGDNGVIVTVEYPNGLLRGNGGDATLEVGNNFLKYVVADSCYNDTTCTINVLVTDLTEPVAICEQNTVVSISQNGNTFLLAESLDDGSWDECGLDRFEVARMDTSCVAQDTLFDDRIAFCCSDAGNEVMVIFRAIDKGGNHNDCMVRVEVQDKQVPLVTCPPNDTIDCRVPYDLNNLAATFGGPNLVDNCPSTQNIVEDITADVNQCGIGTIFRKLNLLDTDNVTILRQCVQTITITNDTPFLVSQIQWPIDVDTTGACMTSDLRPEDLPAINGYPIFLGGDDACSQLGYDYEDKLFEATIGSGECAYIERTWTVINWCDQSTGSFAQFQNLDSFGQPIPQIIRLTNNVAPVIAAQDTVRVESGSLDCKSGTIAITRTATDDCPNALDWSYVIRDKDNVTVGTGDSAMLIDTLIAGNYNITWTVNDFCGNFDVDVQVLEVVNTKTPTPICINGLSGSLVGEDTNGDGQIDVETFEIWAVDFDGGSFHSCDNDITLSLSSDTLIKSITFDCSSIGLQPIQLWVTDQVTGMQDFCSTFIDIQDEGLCPDGLLVAVEGEVYTEDIEKVDEVEVQLGIEGVMDVTEEDGIYTFANMPMGGNYEVEPTKDIDYLNGVSTFDIIHIQRHILGAKRLDSEYKMIAADIDNSQTITAIDLIELRKLILGIYDELPDNSSWRFVDSEYTFLDPSNPWATDFPETYVINSLDTDMNIDFIGVKVGDVNGSVIANAQSKAVEKRSDQGALVFDVKPDHSMNGNIHRAMITSSNYDQVSGWQGTIEYDAEAVEILDIVGKNIKITSDNYNATSKAEGWITISYHSNQAMSIAPKDVLYEIVYRSKTDNATSELFTMTSNVTRQEAYVGEGDIVNVRFSNEYNEETEILSVSPNPWIDNATVEFFIPQNGDGRWEFYDVNGRMLHTMKDTYKAGYNSMIIKRSDIQASGIVYAKLITDTHTTEYKMMLVN